MRLNDLEGALRIRNRASRSWNRSAGVGGTGSGFPGFPRFREVRAFLWGSLKPGCPRIHTLRDINLGIKWKVYCPAIVFSKN